MGPAACLDSTVELTLGAGCGQVSPKDMGMGKLVPQLVCCGDLGEEKITPPSLSLAA